MPVPVTCSGCSTRFRVPDKAAGKRIKCPKCQNVISVPAGDGGAQEPTVAKAKPAATPAKQKATPSSDLWHVKMSNGETYGPVPKKELDEWVAENRVDEQDQLLQEGTEQWKWASELYPDLDEGNQEGSPSDSPFDFAGGGSSSTAGPDTVANAGALSGPPTAASLAATQQAQTEAALADNQQSDKKKMVAGLLGIFLGPFGVHRFYLGYTTIGNIQVVVSLCTFCIGGWWGVIEGILILVGKIDKDSQGRTLID